MKHIEVASAVIIRDGKLFATQRGYGEWKDWWEFPGGKIEPGELPEDALKREIREELATMVQACAAVEVGFTMPGTVTLRSLTKPHVRSASIVLDCDSHLINRP